MTITQTLSPIISAEDYYPLGLSFNQQTREDTQEQNYLYNGFEEQKEWGMYDYQARYYDPVLGRFINVDPAADLMRRHSPYNYAFDNPIYFIDSDGMELTDWFVNSKTVALVFIKGKSKLNNETANKAFGKVISNVIFGSENQFSNWERLGDDNMFDSDNNKISETSSREFKSNEQAEEFAGEHGLAKVKNELVEKTIAISKGPFGGQERVTNEFSVEKTLDSKISYAEPDQIGKITPISTKTTGNRMEATITREKYVQVIDYNKGKENNSNGERISNGTKIASIIYEIIDAFRK